MDSDLAGRRVLVIGGSGYVGSVLVSRLLQAGAFVTVLDQLVYHNGFALQHLLDDARVHLIRGDLRDERTIERATAGVDDVVLLASLVGDPICSKYPDLARQVNADGAKRIIDRLDELGVKRLVFTSTCSNYGIHDGARAADEESELNPQSLYARTKIEVEEHLLASAATAKSVNTVLRIATAYGMSPRMRFDLTVSQFAWELAANDELLVYDADTWRPYCHTHDISRAIMAVLTAPAASVRGEIFNVGDNSQQFTKRMIVEEVQKYRPDVRVEYREGATDPRNYRVSFDKIAERLNFRVERNVQDYIGALVAAVDAGVFADVCGNEKYGNYTVDNLDVL
jgi:nucleoside-diphosphate-sugar epimerase